MTKEEAIAHMIAEVERIEKERLAANFSIDPNKQKNKVVDEIMNALKGVQIDDENQQDWVWKF